MWFSTQANNVAIAAVPGEMTIGDDRFIFRHCSLIKLDIQKAHVTHRRLDK